MDKPWELACSDAIGFLKAQPDDSIDLLFTSPPYEAQRTYGIEFDKAGKEWVWWMFEVLCAARSKVKGLIAVVCEGRTKDFQYSATPFLLMTDLHRAGFNLRKPAVFHRVGIPGSGGPDWLRNDWEPIICVTRSGKLPWSDNTACGHPPKHKPGGRPSHRTKNGDRVGRKVMTIERDGMHSQESTVYVPPPLANPGNVRTFAVGGGKMGHDLAHENEAAFPLGLPEFFVRSFCPPDGTVCDPFAGSSSTGHAAILHGRRYIGCDIRQSQIDLSERRLQDVWDSIKKEKSGEQEERP